MIQKTPTPHVIAVPDDVLEDLRARLRATRFPIQGAPGWDQGVDVAFLRALVARWEAFDWRQAEAILNQLPHFVMPVAGCLMHFLHFGNQDATPLLLLHGWPSTFLELLPLAASLTDPELIGLPGSSFEVIIPALPGYPFSQRRPHHTFDDTAALLLELMSKLGHDRFGVGGGDFGSAIATLMALRAPERVIGLHLTNLEFDPWLGEGASPLSDAEQALVTAEREFQDREGGYQEVQTNRPLSLAFGLTDSPAGLAAWILDKWRSWSDGDGDLTQAFDEDYLLSTLTLLWVDGRIGQTLLDFADNAYLYDPPTPRARVTIPTAVQTFDNEYAHSARVPREWAERMYTVHRWTPESCGGHFAPVENPRAVAQDMAAFFSSLTYDQS